MFSSYLLNERTALIEISQNITEYITSLWGEERAKRYFEFIKDEHTPYLRINRLYGNHNELIEKLSAYGIKLQPVKGIEYAYRVTEGIEAAGKTLEFNTGRYYIQSLSSMIPPLILNPLENDRVLDMCAAPGSKATQLAEMMNNRGTFVANELSMERLKMLVHNVEKLGIANAGILNYKGEWLSRLFNETFDKILLDAPCSALGVIQKKEEVSNWWSRERVAKIAHLQLMLISAAVKMLKTGGEMVYSTCTLTPEENELIIDFVLKKYPLEVLDISLPVASEQGLTGYAGQELSGGLSKAHRIIPWQVDSEGFFIVKLRKTGSVEPARLLDDRPNERIKFMAPSDKSIRPQLDQLSGTFGIPEHVWQQYKFINKGGDIYITDNGFEAPHTGVFNRIGTKFATVDKRGLAHLHSFGAQLMKEYITLKKYEITDPLQLKSYFSGGIVRTGEETKGQFVITYGQQVLGMASSVSGGLKSQYPKSKRIHEISYY